jgi:hypothetical protein
MMFWTAGPGSVSLDAVVFASLEVGAEEAGASAASEPDVHAPNASIMTNASGRP